MPISAREAEVLAWLDTQYQPMVELLGRLVNIDSGSFDKAGVDRTGEILRQHLEERGIACEVTEHPSAGSFLKATVPPGPGKGNGTGNQHVLLLGHRDTVFAKGTVAERPFRIEGDRAYGPGVSDMKSGLVMNAFVLEAFARTGGAAMPLVGLFTSDEEIASPASRPVIEAAAMGARAVLNAEPGRLSGSVVSGRKGAMFLTGEVPGLAAHSGGAREKGVSAIEELCR
jgi:glutamate carboxypeptidase